MSALVCHQRDAVEQEDDVEDVEEDETELKEFVRERAGELEEDSSVRAEETESSLSDTYEIALARAGNVCGAVSSAPAAMEARLLFLRLPPRRVRLGSLCIVAESIRAMIFFVSTQW